MKTSYRILSIFLALMMLSLCTACSHDPLKGWVGAYLFEEVSPQDPDMMTATAMEHKIEIYEENGEYFATINIDGFQTMENVKAKVSGDQKSIDLIFDEYLPDSIEYEYGRYEQGDILLSLERGDSKLITHWGEMTPKLTQNSPATGEYFEALTTEEYMRWKDSVSS